MKKRILALMLACFMIVSLLPMNAFAVETECPGEGNHATENCKWELVEEVTGKCGEWNYNVYKCLDCGELFADDLVQNVNTDDWSEWTVVTEPDCDTDGEETRFCSICEKVETRVIPALGHKWLDLGGDCVTGMQKVCEVCGEDGGTEPGEHTWSEHPVDFVAPDEIGLVNGTAVYACTVEGCQAKKEVDILYHGCGQKLSDWVEAVDATCTEAGTVGHFTCNVCGRYFDEYLNELETIVVEPLGHEYDDLIIEVLPVCEQDGYRKFKCIRCDEEIEEQLTYANHEYVLEADIAPTCTTWGFKAYGCELCGDNYIVPMEPLDHVYPEDYEIEELAGQSATVLLGTDPTCTEDGSVQEFCMLCGEFVGEPITVPATGHNMVVDGTRSIPATCKDVSVTYYYCANGCGEEDVVEGEELDGTNHVNVGYETYVAPTCTEDGYHDFWCYDCNYWYHLTKENDPDLAATGHNIVYFETVEATCYSDGYDVYNCENCGECYEERNVVAEFDHNPIYNVDDVPAGDYDVREQRPVSCKIDGLYVYTCNDCGDIFLVVVPAHGHVPPALGDPAWETEPTETTCTTNGHTGTYNCTVCGELVEGEEEEAYGHNIIAVDRKAPTCEEDGYVQHWYCDRCETYYLDEELTTPIEPTDDDFVLEALGHNEIVLDEHYADLHDEHDYLGYSYTHIGCERGCYEYIINFELAGKHEYVEAERVDATCDQNGFVRYECSCGDEYTDVLFALGHTFEEECANNGAVCERCEAVCDVAHYWDGWNTIEATCLNTKYEIRVCLDCGVYDVNPKGEEFGAHNYGPAEIKYDENGIDTGIRVETCVVCGYEHEFEVERTVDFTAVTNGDLFVKGSTIEVTLYLSGNYANIWGFDLDLFFNDRMLDYAGYELLTDRFSNDINDVFMVKDQEGKISIGANNETNFEVTNEAIVVLYFTVTKDVSARQTVEFTMEANKVLSVDNEDVTAYTYGTSCDLAMKMDIDGDGSITLADALLAFRHFTWVEFLEADELVLADLNDDGEITLDEVMAIYEEFLGD